MFHFLHVPPADGNADHLIDMHRPTRDGMSADQELLPWYDVNESITESAEDDKSQIGKIKISTKSTKSNYINCFIQTNKNQRDKNLQEAN